MIQRYAKLGLDSVADTHFLTTTRPSLIIEMIFPTWSLLVFVTALLMVSSRSSAEGRGVLGVCIQNCGQCKKMYGDFFFGQQCAEECLHTFGFSTPDCNKAASIQRFLGK